MKKLLILSVGLLSMHPVAQAQLLTHEGVAGAGFGALTGGIIGHHSGRHGWEGAAIGAGVGYVLGSLAHQDRVHEGYYYQPSYVYSAPPGYYVTSTVSAPPPPTPAVTESPAPQPTPARIIAPPSNMAGANSLFGR